LKIQNLKIQKNIFENNTKKSRYPSSLTDTQWSLIEPMLPKPKKRERPSLIAEKSLRQYYIFSKVAFNAGCCSRTSLPGRRFILCSKNGTKRMYGMLSTINSVPLTEMLTVNDFGQPKREKRPARWQRRPRCRETHQGQKRHILVDTLGLQLRVQITPATTSDRSGAQELLGGFL
jgi:hypothetical protein